MYNALADAIRDAEARGTSLAQLALDTEARDQGRPVDEIRGALRRALQVMRGAVDQGMVGDMRSASGLVGGDAPKLRSGPPGPLAGTPFRDVLARALAVQEVNAAMGVIVAAPTAGGAGVLPAVLTGLADAKKIGDGDARRHAGAGRTCNRARAAGHTRLGVRSARRPGGAALRFPQRDRRRH